MSRVLVISPHPDDEAIGCGGTLRRHVNLGDDVRVVFLTSGEKGGHGRAENETARLREAEAEAAGQILGVERIDFWRQPDGTVNADEQLADRLRDTLAASPAEFLYVPHEQEMHPDHQAAARLVRLALTSLAPPRKPPQVLMYEVWTPLQQMDEIVDISEFIEIKLAAIRAYRSQCDVLRFDDAALGLNRYRGEMHSWPGGDYAEVFQRMRE